MSLMTVFMGRNIVSTLSAVKVLIMIHLGLRSNLVKQLCKGTADPETIRSAMFDQNRMGLAYLQNLADAETLNKEEVQRMAEEIAAMLRMHIEALHEALHSNREGAC